MAQHDYVIDNQSAPASRADINNVLAAIRTINSGATAPASTAANMLWYETDTNILWKRNEADSAWIALGTVDETNSKFEPNQTFATQAEVEAGTENTKATTSLRVAQAIAALSGKVNYQVFTASGTWTKPTGISANSIVVAQIWAGGGGGGRGGTTSSTAGGGGGGGYYLYVCLASDLAASVSVTVGSGGAGASAAGSGGDGGLSSFNGKEVLGGAGGNGNRSSGNRDGAAGGGWSYARVGGARYQDGGSSFDPDQFGGGLGNYFAFTSVGAFWGGGGGNSSSLTGITTSVHGGNGGATDSAPGTAPGGGGAGRGATSGTAGAGARGEVRVWTIG